MADRRDDHHGPRRADARQESSDLAERDGRVTKGRQKGPQDHAEGQHGSKTHARFIEQLHEGRHAEPVTERARRERRDAAYQGRRRLVEDRQQHDEAEKNSEHTRLFVEHKRGRDDGPSDNTGNLHGVLGHREHRADYKLRGEDGLDVKE
jgi:hypothetical protein